MRLHCSNIRFHAFQISFIRIQQHACSLQQFSYYESCINVSSCTLVESQGRHKSPPQQQYWLPVTDLGVMVLWLARRRWSSFVSPFGRDRLSRNILRQGVHLQVTRLSRLFITPWPIIGLRGNVRPLCDYMDGVWLVQQQVACTVQLTCRKSQCARLHSSLLHVIWQLLTRCCSQIVCLSVVSFALSKANIITIKYDRITVTVE